MPIYAYRCESCGHAKDVLQKVSDPLITTCPACNAESFKKQLTAAGFQLKGSGWYVTDFRSNGTKPEAATGTAAVAPKSEGANGEGAKSDSAKTDSAPAVAAPSSSSTSTSSSSGVSGGTGSSASV
ncbi:MAG: zinc ribbon domain-containing protein [Burkholderiales bacterium]|jgi:putative FmdB family regulatory protein|nr:zinc ribbon domain-containing protein [Burkholderiales bacterium]